MKKVWMVFIAVIFCVGILITPCIADARSGHGGHGGFHGGYSYRGGNRSYGGPVLGLGVGYYPGYYSAPPDVYYPPADIEAPPPEYVEPSPNTEDPDTSNILKSPAAGQIPPNYYEGRCRKWAPTGEYHYESRWNPQNQAMETISAPNFAWQDYPCQ